MSKLFKHLAGLLAVLLLTGAGAAGAADLRIGLRAIPESMEPHYMAAGHQIAGIKNVFEGLVFLDENLQVQPALAESWEPVGERVWRFNLRKGVKFHNGETMTADDVKFSFDRVAKVAGPDGGLVINTRNISQVTVVDPNTVLIETSVANPVLPQDIYRIGIVPRSIGETTIDEMNSGQKAVGTGPFKFESFKARESFVVTAHKDYWAGPADWDKVSFLEISNDAARVAALTSNRVDLINYVPFADVARLKRDSGTETVQGDSIYIFLLYPDHRPQNDQITDKSGKPLAKNPLTDRRVRQALSLAIDRQAIAERALEGFAKPSKQLIDDNFLGAIKDASPLEYNPAKAKQLLSEAGYADGFTIPLYCTNDRLPGDANTCTALGQMFARIGIDTKVNAVSRTVYLPARTRGEYMLTMSGWGDVTGDAGYTLSSIGHTNDPAKGLGAFNVFHLSDPKIDELIATAMHTVDRAERQRLFAEATRLLLDDGDLIPIVQISSVWGARKGMMAFKPRVDEETLPYYIKALKK